MKDLKHLYEFEKLLESANNALVQQACAEGKHALAYTCYHMPRSSTLSCCTSWTMSSFS